MEVSVRNDLVEKHPEIHFVDTRDIERIRLDSPAQESSDDNRDSIDVQARYLVGEKKRGEKKRGEGERKRERNEEREREAPGDPLRGHEGYRKNTPRFSRPGIL
jgi:hypothetical protein